MSIYADISALFGDVFGEIYLDGIVARHALVHDSSGGGTSTVTSEPCKVQVDDVTEAMRRQEGYTSADVRLMVLQASTAIAVDTDCRVTVDGVEYIVGWVGQDPAKSYWECRATPA